MPASRLVPLRPDPRIKQLRIPLYASTCPSGNPRILQFIEKTRSHTFISRDLLWSKEITPAPDPAGVRGSRSESVNLPAIDARGLHPPRSEEHTSELQSHSFIS